MSHGGWSVPTSHCLALSRDSTTIDFPTVLGGKPVLCPSCTTCPTFRSNFSALLCSYLLMYVVVLHTIASSCGPCSPIAQNHHKWMVCDTTWLTLLGLAWCDSLVANVLQTVPCLTCMHRHLLFLECMRHATTPLGSLVHKTASRMTSTGERPDLLWRLNIT